ncbi:MAG TPA: (Fe-S)-binding protein [Elusimicrobiota bacterium]|nr:(Fe-S)-binding protein [Elusimicrobiota bacterium]
MAEQLGVLRTFLGDKKLYDAVSQCSRCGYCEQACPTYLESGREDRSPRGRNQLVRMMLEGKLADAASAEEALSTCLLCGACSSVCPAKVPTADIVLEGRRALRADESGAARRLGALLERPALLSFLLRWAYRLQRWGLATLAARLGLGRLPGLGPLVDAGAHLDEAPRRLLREDLAADGDLREEGAAWVYYPACGPSYVLPRVGLATVRALKRLLGRGSWLDAPCCGLAAYNYGDVAQARAFARKNIERLEASPAKGPLIGDCSSCVAHLKTYPQLFLGEPEWLARAERFSARVQDAVEALPRALGERACAAPGPVNTLHDACRARNGQGIWKEPRAAMGKMCGNSYKELPEADQCCGGAGAFAFVHGDISEELLKRKVANIASVGARVVAASSTSCLLQLARGLKKYYPECKAVHLSELISEGLERADG